MIPSRILRAGVVGFGYLGYHHARIYHSLDDVELVGIVDTAEEQRNKAINEFNVAVFDNVTDLIQTGLDLVSIATPTSTHKSVTLPFLDAGIHVLVEKPIAENVEDAELMVQKAREKRCILQVGHVERFNGAVQALFDLIDQPRFIECHRLSPFPGRGTDVSVVHDLMVHDIDIVMALVNSPVQSIDAVGVAVFTNSEDIANARLRFESGCVANLTASRVSMDRLRKIRIFSTREYVSTDYTSQSLLVYRKKAGPLPKTGNPMEHIEITPINVSREEPLKAEIKSFLDAVKHDKTPVVSGETALEVLKLANRIIDQIRRHS